MFRHGACGKKQYKASCRVKWTCIRVVMFQHGACGKKQYKAPCRVKWAGTLQVDEAFVRNSGRISLTLGWSTVRNQLLMSVCKLIQCPSPLRVPEASHLPRVIGPFCSFPQHWILFFVMRVNHLENWEMKAKVLLEWEIFTLDDLRLEFLKRMIFSRSSEVSEDVIKQCWQIFWSWHTLGPAYNELSYNEHSALMKIFFFQKRILLIDIHVKKFGCNAHDS